MYLFAILIPLFVSWLFREKGWRRVRLTYLVSALLTLGLFLLPFIIGMLRAASIIFSEGAPDTVALASGIPEFAGRFLIGLALSAFFQYIFNKTFGISVKKQ